MPEDVIYRRTAIVRARIGTDRGQFAKKSTDEHDRLPLTRESPIFDRFDDNFEEQLFRRKLLRPAIHT